METDMNVNVKVEPDSGNEASQDENDVKPVKKEELTSESNVENVDIKSEPLEPMDDEPSPAPESITVKLEPTYYSSGDGQRIADMPSTSQNNSACSVSSSATTETNSTNQPKTFEDLVLLWEKNEESEETGFFFAYCRATADCGGYNVDTDTSIDSDEDKDEFHSKENYDPSKYYNGRNGFQWSKTPAPLHGNTKTFQVPSSTIPGEKDPYNIWNCLIDDTILKEILKWTNVKLAECRTQIQNQSHPHLGELDMIELKAFLGTFLLSVCMNLHIQPVDDIFCDLDDVFRILVFQCVMTGYRFLSILNCLSFGDPKLENDSSDKNISVLFEKFFDNCQKMYTGSGYAVLDETIVPFWGSYKDKRFPGKYTERPWRDGFRLQCVFDVKTGFLHNLYIPYVDLDKRHFTKEETEFSEATKLALLLTQPFHGTNTNITCNKEYMSFELIDAFKKRDLTCIGTIAKTNKEIPREFLPCRKRKQGSALYGYSGNLTLMSYMNKTRKATIIASSMLNDDDDDDNIQKKPKLLRFYNSTKIPYHMGNFYEITCHRRTTLVSMALFYKLIDCSIHNAYILYSLNCKRSMDKREMLCSIAKKLYEAHLIRRAMDMTLSDRIRHDIMICLGSEE